MKNLYPTLLLLMSIQIVYSQDCPQPVFDLILDTYTTTMDQPITMSITINDTGVGPDFIFNACSVESIGDIEHGTLVKEDAPSCDWTYTPDAGYMGIDSFHYLLNYVDTCSITYDDYCLPGDGKIKEMTVVYLGDEASDITVRGKNSDVIFASFTNVQPGSFFYVDGSSTSGAQATDWIFSSNNCSETTIHVSCSELIFGNTFCDFLPIGGKTVSPVEEKIVYPNESITDTALVTINIEPTLPLNLLSFDAEREDTYVKVNWKTESENGIDQFLLERSSDGIHFEVFEWVPAIGNSNRESDYSALDYNPLNANGNNYYRLSELDFNGRNQVLQTVAIRLNNEQDQIIVFPNPVLNNELHFKLGTSDEVDVQISLFNTLGKVMASRNVTSAVHTYSLSLNNEIPTGIYMLKIKISDGRNYTQQIIINN